MLGFHVGVAVVLVPREALGGAGFLVNRLIPIETNVLPQQVVAEALKDRVARKCLCGGGAQNGMNVEGDLPCPGDEGFPAEFLPEQCFEFGLQGIEFGQQALENFGLEGVLQQEITIAIVSPGLVFIDDAEGPRVIGPTEILVQGMLFHGRSLVGCGSRDSTLFARWVVRPLQRVSFGKTSLRSASPRS